MDVPSGRADTAASNQDQGQGIPMGTILSVFILTLVKLGATVELFRI